MEVRRRKKECRRVSDAKTAIGRSKRGGVGCTCRLRVYFLVSHVSLFSPIPSRAGPNLYISDIFIAFNPFSSALLLLQNLLSKLPKHKLPNLPTPRQRHLRLTVLAQPKDMHRRFMPAKYLPHPSLHFCQIGLVGAGFVVEEGGGYFNVAGV
jgi:hypothetical protein